MSLYSEYDNFYAANPTPTQLGGRNRALKARRDRYGRFMPADEWRQELWELPEVHGRAGGLKRAETAVRIRGKFARKDA